MEKIMYVEDILTENLKAEMTYGPRIRRVPGQMRKGNEM
jgi:hypothetical protein